MGHLLEMPVVETQPIDTLTTQRYALPQIMFLRAIKRFKDGKEHRYWRVVENRRVAGGRSVQMTLLYLGEINDSDRAAWTRAIEASPEALEKINDAIVSCARQESHSTDDPPASPPDETPPPSDSTEELSVDPPAAESNGKLLIEATAVRIELLASANRTRAPSFVAKPRNVWNLERKSRPATWTDTCSWNGFHGMPTMKQSTLAHRRNPSGSASATTRQVSMPIKSIRLGPIEPGVKNATSG